MNFSALYYPARSVMLLGMGNKNAPKREKKKPKKSK
jgi:hypothetical protein